MAGSPRGSDCIPSPLWGDLNQDPVLPAAQEYFPGSSTGHWALTSYSPLRAQVGSSRHSEHVAGFRPGPTAAAGVSHTGQEASHLPAGSCCCAWALSHFLLAVRIPIWELKFQAVLCKCWTLLREGAALAGKLPARRGEVQNRLLQTLCKYCSCHREGVLFFQPSCSQAFP